MKRFLYLSIVFISLCLSSCMNEDDKPKPILPKFTTLEATDITDQSALLHGIIGEKSNNQDSEENTSKTNIYGMFVYSTSKDFETYSTTPSREITVGEEFSYSVYLEPKTTYYYKFVYAKRKSSNAPEKDVDYLWNVVSFTTK